MLTVTSLQSASAPVKHVLIISMGIWCERTPWKGFCLDLQECMAGRLAGTGSSCFHHPLVQCLFLWLRFLFSLCCLLWKSPSLSIRDFWKQLHADELCHSSLTVAALALAFYQINHVYCPGACLCSLYPTPRQCTTHNPPVMFSFHGVNFTALQHLKSPSVCPSVPER